MGIADKVKGLLVGHKAQAEQAIEKGADMVDKKTGGTHSGEIHSAAEKAKQTIENLNDN